jgi:hypothetical protein
MFYLLLIFGIVMLAAGAFVIPFSVPIRETTFGSALLISGTVAIVGGFVLVGLAAAVQELRRVVQVLRRIPGGPRPVRPAERKEGDRRPPPPRALFPNRPGPDMSIPSSSSVDEPPYDADTDVHAEPRPRVDIVRGDIARADFARAEAARADFARADSRADTRAETRADTRADATTRADQQAPGRKAGPAWLRRAIAEIESIPRPAELPAPVEPVEARRYDEPQPVRRAAPAEAPFVRPGPIAERAPMQDGWVRPRGPVAPAAPAAAMEPREDHAPEPERPPPRQPIAPLPNIFDMVWTNDRRRPASESAPPPEQPSEAPAPIRPLEPSSAPVVQSIPAPAPPARQEPEPRAEPSPEPRVEPRPEPRPEQRPEPRAEPRPEPRPEQRPAPRPLSILKSGVIDEMAYTLFTDGSIEAQMPDGTMRFSSIEDLRRHLDQHDG